MHSLFVCFPSEWHGLSALPGCSCHRRHSDCAVYICPELPRFTTMPCRCLFALTHRPSTQQALVWNRTPQRLTRAFGPPSCLVCVYLCHVSVMITSLSARPHTEQAVVFDRCSSFVLFVGCRVRADDPRANISETVGVEMANKTVLSRLMRSPHHALHCTELLRSFRPPTLSLLFAGFEAAIRCAAALVIKVGIPVTPSQLFPRMTHSVFSQTFQLRAPLRNVDEH